MDILLLLSSDTVKSRNEMLNFKNSCVNFMVLCNEFIWLINSSSLSEPLATLGKSRTTDLRVGGSKPLVDDRFFL